MLNRIYVGVNGDYATLKAAVDWFNASATRDTEILIDAGNHNVAATITVNNSTYGLQIRGLGSAVTYLNAATGLTGTPMFDVRSKCDFNKLTAEANTLALYGTLASENFITFGTTAAIYSEIKDIIINNFKIGVADLIGTNLFIFDFLFITCGVGISQNHATAVDTMLDAEIGNFEGCPIGIQLLKATSASFTFTNLEFLHTASSQIGIAYTGGAGNYVLDSTGGIANISGCMYNLIGTFMSGFDFTLVRDSSVAVTGCLGSEDKKPHAKINTIANVATTTVTVAETYYKAAFTNGYIYACKMTIADGRMTYLSNNIRDGMMWLSGNVAVNHNGRDIKVAIRKAIVVTSVTGNGTTITVTTTNNHYLPTGSKVQMLGWTGGTGIWNGLYTIVNSSAKVFTYLATGNGTATGGTAGAIISPMTTRAVTSGVAYIFSLNAYIDSMQVNDVYDVYLTSSTNNDVVTLGDLTWLFNSA